MDILPEKAPEVFRSGMSANVDIEENSKENTLLLPIEAVKQDKEGSFVLLSRSRGKGPSKHKIEVGISDDENIEVLSGLEEKDRIIIKTQLIEPAKKNRSTSSPFMPFGRRRR